MYLHFMKIEEARKLNMSGGTESMVVSASHDTKGRDRLKPGSLLHCETQQSLALEEMDEEAAMDLAMTDLRRGNDIEYGLGEWC